jgi:hypothetical protein
MPFSERSTGNFFIEEMNPSQSDGFVKIKEREFVRSGWRVGVGLRLEGKGSFATMESS